MGDQSDNGFTFEGRDITSLFLRYAQEFMYYLSPSGTVNYISPNWTNIVGHEPGTVMGKDFRTFIHPGSVSSCDIAFKKVIKGQSEKEYIEYKFKHKCGQLCWHQASCVPQRDDSGNIVQIICIGRDITRQKQVESRLDNSQKQLLSVLDSIDTPIYVSDMDTYELLFVNGAIIRLYDGKIPDAPCYKVLQNLDAPCPFCTNDIIRKTDGLVYRWEHNNIMLNKTFDLMDRVIDWPDGRKVRIEHAVDITDMKKNARLLEAEKERLSVTLRSIGDGVITTDMQGRVMILNRVAEELTGWKQEEAVGRPLEEIFHIINEITRKPHENPVAKVLTTGGIIELANHTLLISRDGTERIIADSGAPIKDKQGKTHGVVLVFRDMTEKTRFIEMTQNAQKLESLGIMAGGIAHDFNNLLAGIFGFIDLAHSASSEDIVKSHLGTALSTIDRARALSGQLLTFAKGGGAKSHGEPTVSDGL